MSIRFGKIALASVGILWGFLGLVKPAFAVDAGWLDQLSNFIRQQQYDLHRQLAEGLQAVAEGGVWAVWGLVALGFFYGVFHAAGPGHGKAVIGTYILSQGRKMKESLWLSFMAALMQGVTAIFLVLIVSYLAEFTVWGLKDAIPVVEQGSFILITLLGLFLLFRAMRQFIRLKSGISPAQISPADIDDQPPLHDHHDHHDHRGHHDHSHGEERCDHCGHGHLVGPDQIKEKQGWQEKLAIVMSIGLRPCSGSVIVLTFAELLDLRLVGILTVLAISVGTALTVSFLALLAVYARDMAAYLGQKMEKPILRYMPAFVSFLGGVVIFTLGCLLTVQAFTNAHPLL